MSQKCQEEIRALRKAFSSLSIEPPIAYRRVAEAVRCVTSGRLTWGWSGRRPWVQRPSTRRGTRGGRPEQVARRGGLDDDRRIVRQQESARHEVLRGDPDPVHVIVTVAIALLDREAGIARAFPLRFRRSEWGEGANQHAGPSLRLILAAVRASRHSNIRQPNPTGCVSVSITLRHLNHGRGKPGRGAQRGRLAGCWLERHQYAGGRLGVQAYPGVEAQQRGACYGGPIEAAGRQRACRRLGKDHMRSAGDVVHLYIGREWLIRGPGCARATQRGAQRIVVRGRVD